MARSGARTNRPSESTNSPTARATVGGEVKYTPAAPTTKAATSVPGGMIAHQPRSAIVSPIGAVSRSSAHSSAVRSRPSRSGDQSGPPVGTAGGVAQDPPGGVDLAHLIGVAAGVGVVLAGAGAVGGTQLVRRRRAGDAEHVVVRLRHLASLVPACRRVPRVSCRRPCGRQPAADGPGAGESTGVATTVA